MGGIGKDGTSVRTRDSQATTTNEQSFTPDGQVNQDGSVRINFLHIINPNTANFGAQFGQNIEPSGEYMSYISENQAHIDLPNYKYGVIQFKKPLILEWKSSGENGWKKDLSNMFGGKTGKALSNAIKKQGYDGILTYDELRGQRYWSEIVNLSGIKEI